MEWILIVSLIATFGFGFFLADRFDRFHFSREAESERAIPAPKPSGVLIFGSSDLARNMAGILGGKDIGYQMIGSEKDLNVSLRCSHLLALSEDDYDNLVVCNIANRMMGVPSIMAVCNNQENRTVFSRYAIPFIPNDGLSAQDLYNTVFARRTEDADD